MWEIVPAVVLGGFVLFGLIFGPLLICSAVCQFLFPQFGAALNELPFWMLLLGTDVIFYAGLMVLREIIIYLIPPRGWVRNSRKRSGSG